MAKKEAKKDLSLAGLRQSLREKKNHEEGFANLMEEQPLIALEKCLGKKIPDYVNVHFVEDTLDKLYVILPANPEELNDEHLEFVSGGHGGEPPKQKKKPKTREVKYKDPNDTWHTFIVKD